MRVFNYSLIKEQKWDSELLGLVAAIYKEAGKQDLYLKHRPDELEKLVEIAKVQSTESGYCSSRLFIYFCSSLYFYSMYYLGFEKILQPRCNQKVYYILSTAKQNSSLVSTK